MKKVVRVASPAAIAVLRQATALFPKRKKASDGLLPSLAHIKQNPNSDHNSGLAVDLTHDPRNGIDCVVLYQLLQKDKRVSYLIFRGRIWSKERGDRVYTGYNKHVKHIHISIKEEHSKDTSPWFPWLKGASKKTIKDKAVVAVSKVRRPKKKDKPSPKEN